MFCFQPCLLTPILCLRFAETQTASNGLRYRDWVCTYASDRALDKCRLEAHIVDITHIHQSLVPWKRNDKLEWALVRSSLPLEQRVLHDRSSQPDANNDSRFQAFVRSCKARLLQDIKCLPVSDEASVERKNVTHYADEAAQQFLVVYSPTGSSALQFVSVTLLPN